MEEIQQTALALLRKALFNRPLQADPETDWQAVCRELSLHAVACLPGGMLAELPGLDDASRQRWSVAVVMNMRRFYGILQAQSALLTLLQEAGIRSVVIKGTAAAMYYPNPDYRSMGDVDLLVEEGRADEAMQLMLANGYALSEPLDHNPRHYSLNRDGVEFEIHKSFAKQKDGGLDALLFEGINKAETACIAGFEFPVLPRLQNGLVLLTHAYQHLQEGVGLRHVSDWMMYAAAELDDLLWHGSFRKTAAQIGLERFAVVLTAMAQRYLGLSLQDRTWCRAADEESCESLLAFVLANGDFGVKYGEKRIAAREWMDVGNLRQLFGKLQEGGLRNHRRLFDSLPFLKPFAWLFRIFRLLFVSMKRGLGIREVLSSYDESRDRIVLFRRLGLRTVYEEKH